MRYPQRRCDHIHCSGMAPDRALELGLQSRGGGDDISLAVVCLRHRNFNEFNGEAHIGLADDLAGIEFYAERSCHHGGEGRRRRRPAEEGDARAAHIALIGEDGERPAFARMADELARRRRRLRIQPAGIEKAADLAHARVDERILDPLINAGRLQSSRRATPPARRSPNCPDAPRRRCAPRPRRQSRRAPRPSAARSRRSRQAETSRRKCGRDFPTWRRRAPYAHARIFPERRVRDWRVRGPVGDCRCADRAPARAGPKARRPLRAARP